MATPLPTPLLSPLRLRFPAVVISLAQINCDEMFSWAGRPFVDKPLGDAVQNCTVAAKIAKATALYSVTHTWMQTIFQQTFIFT